MKWGEINGAHTSGVEAENNSNVKLYMYNEDVDFCRHPKPQASIYNPVLPE